MQTTKSSPSTAPTLGSPSAVRAYTPSASTSTLTCFASRSADEANGFVLIAQAGLTLWFRLNRFVGS